jgi:hypothetical protein
MRLYTLKLFARNERNTIENCQRTLGKKAKQNGLTYAEARRLSKEEEKRLMRLEQIKRNKDSIYLNRLNDIYNTVWQFTDLKL